MPIINFTDPINVLAALVLYVLVLFLAREMKRSNVTAIMLLVFLTIIVAHCIEYVMVQDITGEITTVIARSITIDYIFIFLSFIAYLWTDEIESKERKIKSIDDSINWFWKKV